MTLSNAFAYYELPAARVSSIAPSYAMENSSDKVPVTIRGSGFKSGAEVKIDLPNPIYASALDLTEVKVVDDTKITASVSSFEKAHGNYDVTVTNPDHTGALGKELFTVTDIVPSFELNQGVPMNCATRPCVADHNTWVRMKLGRSGKNVFSDPAQPATGRLFVVKDGEALAGSPFRPLPIAMNLSYLESDALDATKLAAAGDSLNFRFDGTNPRLADGTYDFRFEIDPRNPATVPSGGPDRDKYLQVELKAQKFRTSTSASTFRLLFLLDQGAAEARLRPVDVMGLAEMIRAAFPVSRSMVQILVSPSTSIRLSDYSTLDAAVQAVAKLGASESKWITTYAVLVSTNLSVLGADMGAGSCRGNETSFWCSGNGIVLRADPTEAPATLAHETGHLMLLGDTYFSNSDPAVEMRSPNNPTSSKCLLLTDGCPVDGGNLDTLLGTVSLPMTSDAPDSWVKRDLMGNAARSKRWIDTRSWDFLYAKFNTAAAAAISAQPSSSDPQFIRVSGTIDHSGHVAFDPATRVVGDDSNPNSGPYSATLEDGQANALASQSFDLSFRGATSAAITSVAPFGFTLPLATGATRLVLRQGTSVLGSQPISKNPPTVRVISPNGGETAGSTTRISWDASDPDGDLLSYDLFYSMDGTTWSAIATGVTATQYDWDTSLATGSKAAKIMVTANDGWNETSDTTDGVFTMPGKAPSLRFDTPGGSTTILASQALTLGATAYDLEEGFLSPDTIAFTSSQQGLLGTGSPISVSGLKAGTHVITATATDKDGNKGTVTTSVTVVTSLPKRRAVR